MMEIAPLEADIRRRIAVGGPMGVAQYMELCLAHPERGYYATRDPFGASGDFTTAPEISQMFGELIGLWAAATWRATGSPGKLSLVELGPGRGTMMVDVLRAAKVVPDFRATIDVQLNYQYRAFGVPGLGLKRGLAEDLVIAPYATAMALMVAPEAACKNLERMANDGMGGNYGWHERVIKLEDEKLHFSIHRDPLPLFDKLLPSRLRAAKIGDIFEWRADNIALEIGRRVARRGGGALMIDYGHAQSAIGDTLQAVGGHQFVEPLLAPGLVDLTAHVDFEALAHAAEGMGARVHGPVPQGEFLRGLGIEQRAAALKAAAPSEYADAIDAALVRLTSEDRTGMGRLFKAIGVADPKLERLPGFEA